MQNYLNVHIYTDDATQAEICQLNGQMTSDTLFPFKSSVATLKTRSPSRIILDLSAIHLLGSAGLGETAQLIMWCQQNKCTFEVVCDAKHIIEELNISGLQRHFTLYKSLPEALNQPE